MLHVIGPLIYEEGANMKYSLIEVQHYTSLNLWVDSHTFRDFSLLRWIIIQNKSVDHHKRFFIATHLWKMNHINLLTTILVKENCYEQNNKCFSCQLFSQILRRHLEIWVRGGECLSNAHWLSFWRPVTLFWLSETSVQYLLCAPGFCTIF